MSAVMSENHSFFHQLRKYYAIYTGGFIAFVIALAIAEQMGIDRKSTRLNSSHVRTSRMPSSA